MIKAYRTLKADVGGLKLYKWREKLYDRNWLNGSSKRVLLIMGISREDDEDIEDEDEKYVQDLTRPFIIFREAARRGEYFWMQLDLENPNEPQGGDLTADAAINAVSKEIRKISRSFYPAMTPKLFREEDG